MALGVCEMFKPTLEMQEYIDNNADKIEKLASKLWDAANEVDPDPMHPQWDSFVDPIKDKYITAASYLVLINETTLI